LTLIAACGGSTPPPEAPEASDVPAAAPTAEPEATAEAHGDDEAKEHSKPSAEAKPKADVATPEFKEGMSVEEAIKLIPRDAERMNLDSDALGKPLMNQALYEPCKLGHNHHFKLRVAIWNGKAVGLDVTTQPNNPKASECVAQQIRALTWPDKVPSLNTVEYSM
jgi:hypothetical protein